MSNTNSLVGKESPNDNHLSPRESEVLSDLEAGKYSNQDYCRKHERSSSQVDRKDWNGKSKRKKLGHRLEEEQVEDPRKEYYVQKYTVGIPACESVIVSGIPSFLQIVDGKPILSEKIMDIPDMILKPIDRTSYLNKEYSFQSADQINEYIKRAYEETLDTLYQKAKSIWQKYIDADNDHIAICAADTIFTYFQDKLGMTHYLLFVGDNNAGKSNNLVVFQYLGYRALFDTSITPANIYQYLGGIEEGQGIILEDEMDNVDQLEEKMRIYKVGYKSGTKVSRIDTSFGRRQQSYWTYCFKAFSAERQPDGYRGKGFNERTFVIMCSAGNPKYDIAEIISPAGDEKYKASLDELLDLRNLLLVYRLLHHNDIIPDIQLTIKNRDKQLCKPLIRLFQKSKEAVSEIIASLSKLLLEKKQRKENTLEARLYTLILDLVAYHGLTLKNELIWSTFKEEVEGTDNPNKPQSYDTVEYYTISQRRITDILVDKFGAIRAHDGNSRILRFDQDKLNKLASNYAAVDTIEIITEGSNKSTNEEKEDKKSADTNTNTSNTSNTSTENIDHNAEVSFNEKSSSSISLAEDLYKNEQNNKNITSKENNKIHAKSVEVLDPLEVLKASSAAKRRGNDENNNNNDLLSQVERSIFRLGQSDTWGCMHCRIKDDKWFMRTHHCSGLAKKIFAAKAKANAKANSTISHLQSNHSKLSNVENERKELKVESAQ